VGVHKKGQTRKATSFGRASDGYITYNAVITKITDASIAKVLLKLRVTVRSQNSQEFKRMDEGLLRTHNESNLKNRVRNRNIKRREINLLRKVG
jgi:oligoribonuclease (3'-5' exoribonuclease)